MSADAIERLELKIAYLERANNELSDVVYKQQQELDELRSRLALLANRLEALKSEEPAYTPEQERPPHY
jgi:SlyX protein